MWDFRTSTHNHNWKPGSIGAGYIFAPGSFGADYSIFDYSIRTWTVGPDLTDDIEREYRRHLPLHPMVFRFFIDPSGGIHDAGQGFHNLTGKPVESVIEYLRREDNRLHDGRKDVKPNRISALDELKKVISKFIPKIAHDLSWVKGNKGKGILLNEGKLVTWTVNKKNKPDHISMYEYITGGKLPNDYAFDYINGFPFDIDEDGAISTLKETPEDAVKDIHKIDYRLKLSKTSNELMNPQGFAQTNTGLMIPTQQQVPAQQFYIPGTDVNKGYQTKEPGAADYDWDTDPLNLKQHQELLDEMDVGLENLNDEELKVAVSNAMRVALLSPNTPLHDNAAIYQSFLNIPYNETDPKVYMDAYHKLQKDYQKGPKIQKGDKIQDYSPATTDDNVKYCAKAAAHINEAVAAVREDLEKNDGEGNTFRTWMKNNIGGAGAKVASFTWLMLNPNQSNLATLDRHMFNMLNKEYSDLNPKIPEENQQRKTLMRKELGSYRYLMWERVLRERAMNFGFPPEATNALIQWYLWDAARTNDPQSHAALRAIDPDSYLDVDWKGDALSGSAFGIETRFPNWEETQQAGDLAQQQWEEITQQVLNEGADSKLFVRDKATGLPKKDPTNLSWQDIEKIEQSRPDLLDYFLRSQSKTAGLNEYVEMVPTQVLAKYAEYTEPISEEHLASLEEDIKTNGIQEPIVIDYDQDTGQAHISEGNHRILVAQNLGIESVPAFVYRSSRKGQKSAPADLVKEDSWADPFDPSGFRVPQYMKPSQIKIARPVDPEWWGQQSQEDPYVYHVTSGDYLQSIAQSGLNPWDSENNPNPSQYENVEGSAGQDLTPRTEHIYFFANLQNKSAMLGAANWPSNPVILRTNKNNLNPNQINPDEDNAWVFASNDWWQSDAAADVYSRPLKEGISPGVVAEEVGFGDNPRDTRRTIEKGKTLAYRGFIAPENLEYQSAYDSSDNWQPITNLLQQQLSVEAKAAVWDKPMHKLTRAELVYIATR
jgi:hypothetical protein